jgi:hypothetical protein
VDAIVGQGYQFEGVDGYLQTNDAPTILGDKKLALAAWVKPSADTRATIMRANELFGIARLETGNIGWAFRTSNVSGLIYHDTGVNLALGRWSHVVVMLDGTAVRTYVNGRLAHTEPNVGDVINPSSDAVTIGGSDSNTDYFKGVLDELQIFQHGLSDAEIEQLFLAGNAGVCVPTNPVITWPAPAPITYGFPLNSTQLNATANVPGTFNYSPPSGTLLPVGERTLSVTFTPTDNANYNTVTATNTLIVNKATPTVAVTGGTFTYDGRPHGASVTVTGVGGVDLGDLGPAMLTYDGSADTPVNAGTYVAVATFDGSENYGQATGSAVVTILKATAVLGWSRPAGIVYGTSLGGDQLNATADVFGAFDYSPAAGTVLNAGVSQTLTATFSPSDPANYTGGTVTTAIDVSKAVAEVTAIGGTFTYTGQPHSASGFVTGIFGASLGTPTFTYNGSAQPPVTVGTYEVVASFAGNANYEPASATTAIVVLQATAILGWEPVQPIVYGTPLGDAQLRATASVPGTFTYVPPAGTVLNAGAHVLTARFTPDDRNYSSDGIVNTAIDVSKATPILNWAQPAAIVYGTPLGAGQLNATSNVSGTFTYSRAAGTVLGAGSHQLTATFTPVDPPNYIGGSVSMSIAVAAASLTIRANDAAKPFGAPLPAFSASAAGFVNGDTFASLIGTLGFATTATPQSPVGVYPITVGGLGSPNYTITYVTGTLAVVRGGVTVAVATSPAPSGLDQSMTFTANVSAAAPAAGVPGGTVRFFDGATLLGSGALASGTASLTTAGLAAGVHTIRATYDGDASFETANGSASHIVNTAASTPAIALDSNRNPSNVGQSVTLTASLSMSAGPVTGTVQFYDGATLLGSSTIASGSASFTTAAFANGSHAITVRYLGSASAPATISSVFVQAVGAPGWKNRTSSTTLSVSPNPSAPGASLTLTANVTGSNGMPAGAVLFMVNGQVVGGPVTLTALSGSTAQAALVLPGLAGGRHLVTATYLGSSNYKGSTVTVTQTVN